MPGFHESLDAALTRAEQTDAAEVETLAALIAKAHPFWSSEVRGLHVCIAKDILASDWLAADRAAQRRLGAEAVVAVEPDSLVDAMDRMDAFWGAFKPEMVEPCPDDCGRCFQCGASWSRSWTYAALSNVSLVWQVQEDARAAAQQIGGER